nr:hypothetical protein 29 [Bacillaceae bacterium]
MTIEIGRKFRPKWIVKNHIIKYYGFPEDSIGTITEVNETTVTVQFVKDELTLNIAVYIDELEESGEVI